MRGDADPPGLTIEGIGTPLGDVLLVAWPDERLCASEFADREERLHRLLDRRIGKGRYRLAPGRVAAAIKLALERYFDGDLAAIDTIPLTMGGTSFQQEMWTALRTIPPGTVTSYAGMAMTLRRPGAARAIGHANAANPFEIIVPCHRLVGSDGALTGYAGGLRRKRWLLDHEGRHALPGAAATSAPVTETIPGP